MNDFYSASGTPADGAGLQSAEMRAEFLLIETAMNKLPTTTGNAGEIIAVNSSATALEAITTTGTGSGVRAISPTLVTPILGVATATSVNKVAITQPATSATVTIADGKTLTASNTLTLTATDGSTLAIGTGGSLGTAAYIAASSKQDADATLTSISALGTAADKLAYTTNVDTWAETTITAFARSILDDANEATFKATVNLEIGTDVQAYDADLATWAGVTPGTGVATALAVNVGSAGSVVTNGGALGTPSSGALDNCTSNTEAAGNNSTQLATTEYADRLTAGTLAGAFTVLGVSTATYIGTTPTSTTNIGLEISGGNTPGILGYNRNTAAYLPVQLRGLSYSIRPNDVEVALVSSTGLAVTGSISATTTIKTGGYTVGTLPAGVTGDRAYVTDANAPTYLGALTGGGAVSCPAYKNATAWVSA